MRWTYPAVLLALVTAATACSGGDGPTPTDNTPAAVATVTLTASASTVDVGQTVQITPTLRDATGNVLTGRTVQWSASPSGRAVISSTGVLSALQPGDVLVAAAAEGKTGNVTVTITSPPVASITIESPSNELLTGSTLQLHATAKSAGGATVTGQTVTWSVAPAGRASISSAGVLTGIAPGAVEVTASIGSITATFNVTIIDARNIPFFEKPYAGDFPIGNPFDHDIPKEHVDNNTRFVTYWGEMHTAGDGMYDGHAGWDFMMPTGTPLLAMAPGRVVRIETSHAPFFCPPLNRDVTDQAGVWVEHLLPGGLRVQAWYVHLSRIDVTLNQQVSTGTQLGLAGNTGCSTAPHLHLEIFRMSGTTGRTIDPFGWSGVGADPWEQHPDGAASIYLWKSGAAPKYERELRYDMNAVDPFAPLVLTRLVYEGVNDAANPNNEYIELTLDTRFAATLSLNNFGIRPLGNPALDYRFPDGLTLTAAQPTVRVYTGAGTNSGLTLYMGRTLPLWPNNPSTQCANVLYPTGMSARYFACSP